ncbi:CAAX amino terminal protease self-immunity [Jeotgalicoccus aerolatus]|uniref:Membrane protease YdiL (CAAX protease family) n=1 Tax=Jeotgalicoccus aerolatus TaxID=709510 RepID=A0ABS4HPT3_9STAP|nr:type II CAAX endopeptidase family protein [Jeotgalicoccus aerolatus]MBP1952911.1 membrane protease YdiL (CAAX protease family) [Jeotgalicoccus aerolatus]GGE07036.1 CAAX amino protease [Jeotgalicoccus aerolatus]CAD2080233.1 CAAX amino terminal protease self-immunity [Jeotgalicoccus aerolatus]
MRRVYSILIILTFLAVQFALLPIGLIFTAIDPSLGPGELIEKLIPYQVITFGLGAVIVILIGNIHKNKNRIELGSKTDGLLTTVWIIGGVVLAYLSQIIAGVINIYVFNNPVESQNTTEIVDMIFNSPWMILVVVLFGPIIEEYVFRRAIFGEIYEMIPINSTAQKVLAFLAAGLVSGLIFAVAHADFTHILIYLSMSYVFSFLYVITGRLLVPIFVHVIMNGIVVLLQTVFADFLQEAEEIQNQLNAIISIFM